MRRLECPWAGFALPLTGSTGQDVGGYIIPPNTPGAAQLDSSRTVSFGSSNAVRTPGFFGAYLGSATFSNGAYTQVIGAVAVGEVPDLPPGSAREII